MKKLFLIPILLLSFALTALAATIGVIDATFKYAKILDGPYAGTQIDFRPNDTASVQAIEVRNDRIRGYAWGEATGYIVFSCEDTTSGCSATNGNFKVVNDGSGNLSGYAWGANTGWIVFSCVNTTSGCSATNGNFKVTITSGVFSGYAWSQNFGYIQFDCNVSGACLHTDWAPGGGTTTSSSTTGGGGSGYSVATASSTTGTSTTGTTTGGDATAGDTTGGETTATSTTGGETTSSDTTGGETAGDATTGGDATGGETSGDAGTSGAEGSAGTTGGTGGGSGSGGGGGSGIVIFGGTGILGGTGGETFQEVKKIVTAKVKSIVKKVSDPEFINAVGEETAKAIPVAGVAAGLVTTLTSLFFTNAVSFSEILFLPLRIWSSVLLLFGITRKPWGIVYDSLTKQPIDPAYVSLVDIITDDEVSSSLTDINGRYGFDNVKAGRYKIVASKTHYKFPSTYLQGQESDEIYEDLYHGEEFDVLEDGALITKNIPIDAESVDWNEVAKREQNLMSFNPVKESRWQKIAHFIFVAGFIGSMLMYVTNPNLINKISLGFYVISGTVMYVLRIPKIRALLSKSHALVVEHIEENPVPFAMVEIKNPETGVVVTKRVTNQDGLFYALLEKGKYKVAISKQEHVGSYNKVFESDTIEVKKGFISSKFEI